ncbi:MAG: hypothetical protein JNL08_14585 [Planctomycetes bacterium]|nr:hypothetical protein [Planctomycetota bacterium]
MVCAAPSAAFLSFPIPPHLAQPLRRARRGLLLPLLLAAVGGLLPAQVVRVANHSLAGFDGWVRTTVDTPLPFAAGTVGGSSYVRGRPLGLDAWVVDVHVSLAPYERRTIDLGAAVAAPVPTVMAPTDPVAHFGGALTVDGVPLFYDLPRVDGAALTVRGHVRTSPMLHTEVWLRWYPDQPGIVYGEALVTASNAGLPDLAAAVPATGLRLAWGDGMVHVPGAGWGEPLVPAGTTFADGQARAVPFVALWWRHFATLEHWSQAYAAVGLHACAAGIDRLWPGGMPAQAPGFDAVAWSYAHFGESLRRLHTWEPGAIGPNANSADTGAQWDQVFVCGEYAEPDGIGAEVVAYLGALKLAARPCHHREPDGRQADPQDHPQCVFWSGRPHWHTGVSPDQLGKTGTVTIEATNGWMGPDREHWLYNTVAAAARLTGSPLLQRELEQQARLFLFGETVTPGWSTSGADAARSVGWAGILVTHLWRNLEDRVLAQRVAQRWLDRVDLVYLPQLWNQPYDVWDVRIDDPRLGPGAWWMAWQQSIGAFGLDLACEQLGHAQGRVLARKAALACLDHNWIQQGTQWHGVGNLMFPPPAPAFYDGITWPEPWFETTWDLPALAVVRRQVPGHAKANAVWTQVMGDLGPQRRSWLPPGS